MRTLIDSPALIAAGDTFTNMRHLESPPSESASKYLQEASLKTAHATTTPVAVLRDTHVSFEFRYGVCLDLVCRAAMTSPSADSDALIEVASLSCWPVAPDREMRSHPAKSIKESLDVSYAIFIISVSQ